VKQVPTGIRLFSPPHHEALAQFYSAGGEVTNANKLVYTAGQTPIDETGAVVGVGDVEAQATRVFENLARTLAGADMTLANVVKTTSYLVSREDIAGFAAARTAAFSSLEGPNPASTVVIVASLAHPDFLVEVEAVAAEGA
jgi:enamine deaminase RidA (YjgF/YER057c/UK114 family)